MNYTWTLLMLGCASGGPINNFEKENETIEDTDDKEEEETEAVDPTDEDVSEPTSEPSSEEPAEHNVGATIESPERVQSAAPSQQHEAAAAAAEVERLNAEAWELMHRNEEFFEAMKLRLQKEMMSERATQIQAVYRGKAVRDTQRDSEQTHDSVEQKHDQM